MDAQRSRCLPEALRVEHGAQGTQTLGNHPGTTLEEGLQERPGLALAVGHVMERGQEPVGGQSVRPSYDAPAGRRSVREPGGQCLERLQGRPRLCLGGGPLLWLGEGPGHGHGSVGQCGDARGHRQARWVVRTGERDDAQLQAGRVTPQRDETTRCKAFQVGPQSLTLIDVGGPIRDELARHDGHPRGTGRWQARGTRLQRRRPVARPGGSSLHLQGEQPCHSPGRDAIELAGRRPPEEHERAQWCRRVGEGYTKRCAAGLGEVGSCCCCRSRQVGWRMDRDRPAARPLYRHGTAQETGDGGRVGLQIACLERQALQLRLEHRRLPLQLRSAVDEVADDRTLQGLHIGLGDREGAHAEGDRSLECLGSERILSRAARHHDRRARRSIDRVHHAGRIDEPRL